MSEEQKAKVEQLIVEQTIMLSTIMKDWADASYEQACAMMAETGQNPPNFETYVSCFTAGAFECFRFMANFETPKDLPEDGELFSHALLQFHTLNQIVLQAEKHFGTKIDTAELFGSDYLELDGLEGGDFDPFSPDEE